MNDINILAIGNSFSQDAVEYLHKIAKADNCVLNVVNLFIGGCSLETHWNNIVNNEYAYQYQLNAENVSDSTSINEVICGKKWDFITLQQVSHESGRINSYYPYIDNLYNYVKKEAPNSEVLIHQTWAYEPDSTHQGFLKYNNNQLEMYDSLLNCYNEISERLGGLRLIPCGKAMQLARQYDLNLSRDGFHASLLHGRYLLGAVWYQTITGNDITKSTYCPDGITDKELKLLKKCAKEAI